jgi:hypothetical protein
VQGLFLYSHLSLLNNENIKKAIFYKVEKGLKFITNGFQEGQRQSCRPDKSKTFHESDDFFVSVTERLLYCFRMLERKSTK